MRPCKLLPFGKYTRILVYIDACNVHAAVVTHNSCTLPANSNQSLSSPVAAQILTSVSQTPAHHPLPATTVTAATHAYVPRDTRDQLTRNVSISMSAAKRALVELTPNALTFPAPSSVFVHLASLDRAISTVKVSSQIFWGLLIAWRLKDVLVSPSTFFMGWSKVSWHVNVDVVTGGMLQSGLLFGRIWRYSAQLGSSGLVALAAVDRTCN